MLYVSYYDFPAPIGRLGIAATDIGLTHIFVPSECPVENAVTSEIPHIKEAAKQLREYFSGNRKIFDLPLSPQGSSFRKQVWGILLTIPYGQTCSYKDIAIKVQNPKAFQAIGQANAHNPLPIVIPCHRVVTADGSLGGYSLGLNSKAWLLDLEQANL